MSRGGGRWRAFEGPNGWYVAYQGEDGFHSQPYTQSMTEREAKREARRLERDDDAEVRS